MTTKKITKSRSVSVKGKRKAPVLLPALTVDKVFHACSDVKLSFRSTNDITPSHEIISQKRAVRAIDMGLSIRQPGYNIYVAGYQGTGKNSVIRTFLEKWSFQSSAPNDWIYVYNFNQKEMPRAISLPPGEGFFFKKLMEKSIHELRKEIPKALQSEDYENVVNLRLSQTNDSQAKHFAQLEKFARDLNFQIKSTKFGIETIPIIDGRPTTEKEYNKLGDKERAKVEKVRAQVEPRVLKFARTVRALESDAKEFVNNLQREIGKRVIDDIMGPLREKHKNHVAISEYLQEVSAHIIDNLLDFIEEEAPSSPEEESPFAFLNISDEDRDKCKKYRINLFIDNRNQTKAPVVIESNPTYYNMFGKVEKNVENGMFLTDFTMIKAGAIHHANGGYLVLEAGDVLKMPSVWDTLKRVLRNRKGFIEDMGEQYSMLPTSGLRPEPIPLDVKVILIGTDEIYHLLHDMDEEFSKIFKIKADFDYKMPRNRENIASYVSFIATRSHKEGLLHFERSGVGAIIEYGSRLVDDQKSLSTQFGELKDLTIEANFIAQQERSKTIKRHHVESALKDKFNRVSLYQDHLLEMVQTKDLILSVDGDRIGQINGLTVYDMGDYSFGKVCRITCTSGIQEGGVFHIDRATKLSGNIHDKGVMILTGFLTALLAQKYALSYSASICFEQSYGPVDGDSATIAELISVVSAIAEIPIHQNFAVTGSLNQFGDVQPVGGINEKIEGFLQTCKRIGRKKAYHVIIPHQNVTNLMLNEEARRAVRDKYLVVHPVQYFWQAFYLATGVEFGATSIHDRKFAPDSALEKIRVKLAAIHEEEVKEHAETIPYVVEDKKKSRKKS